MGFDAWFFARLDYEDKEKRLNEKSMEFVWRPNSKSLGTDTQIFTHALYRHYSSPAYFDFDIGAGKDDPAWINDDNEDNNADSEAEKFKKDLDERQSHYVTNDLFVVFGGDFQYVNAFQNYKNMDAMIEYMNKKYPEDYHLIYSTPSLYIDSL